MSCEKLRVWFTRLLVTAPGCSCLVYIINQQAMRKYSAKQQFGFMTGRSSLQQLLLFMNNILEARTPADVIYLDFRKAFNLVPHNILLYIIYKCPVKLRVWFTRLLVTAPGCSCLVYIIDQQAIEKIQCKATIWLYDWSIFTTAITTFHE